MNDESDQQMQRHLNYLSDLDVDAEKRKLLENIATKIQDDSRDRFMRFLALYNAGLVDVDIEAGRWSKCKWEVEFRPNNIGKAIKNLLEMGE